MSTYVRAKTRRQQRHPGSNDPSHINDKRSYEARPGFLAIPKRAAVGRERDFAAHGLVGHEYRRDEDGTWIRCEQPEDFGDFIEEQARLRAWFMDLTRRGERTVEMRRKVKAAIEVITVSFAPWVSDWVFDRLAAGEDPRRKLAAIRTAWLESALKLLVGLRFVLGYAFHPDTDDLHFDLISSRQDDFRGKFRPWRSWGATGRE